MKIDSGSCNRVFIDLKFPQKICGEDYSKTLILLYSSHRKNSLGLKSRKKSQQRVD